MAKYSSSRIVTPEDIIVGTYWIKYGQMTNSLYKVVKKNPKYATIQRIMRYAENYLGEKTLKTDVVVADINEPLEILLERYEYVTRAEVLIHW